MKLCSEPDCKRVHYGLGLCRKHYERKARTGSTKLKTAKRGSLIAFIQKAAKSQTDDCIIWPFSIKPNGYGQLLFEGKQSRAHRVALTLAKGPPPSSKHLATHLAVVCHNRLCCNPRHLSWATPTQNCLDKHLDGTMPTGKAAQNHDTPIDEYLVLSIRGDNRSHSAIADDHGISKGAVGKIKRRERWGWL